ncbi:hypothetical protein OSTOST_06845, partial [Ostertagia ostertagi]
MIENEPCCSSQPQESREASRHGDDRKAVCANSSLPTSPEAEDVDCEEDIVDLCRRLDTQLEEKAKMHNLNALNVKSILHRLIKDPHVLSTLMGIKGDTDGIPSLKVTRSKVKHTAEPAKVELKPVAPPRTFLDVQFENEDEDEDYRPEDAQSDESDDDDEGNETLTTHDAERTRDREDALDISDLGDSEVSPYQLRSRIPNVDDSLCDSLKDTFAQDSFDTFTDYHGQ